MRYLLVFLGLLPFMIICLLAVGAWSFLTYKKVKKWKERRRRCTLKVGAVVTEVLYKQPHELHMRGGDPVNKPVFKVCLHGNEIIIDSARYTNMVTFHPDQEYWLFVNPDDFQDFIYGPPYGTVMMALDVGICLAGFAAMLIAFAVMMAS